MLHTIYYFLLILAPFIGAIHYGETTGNLTHNIPIYSVISNTGFENNATQNQFNSSVSPAAIQNLNNTSQKDLTHEGREHTTVNNSLKNDLTQNQLNPSAPPADLQEVFKSSEKKIPVSKTPVIQKDLTHEGREHVEDNKGTSIRPFNSTGNATTSLLSNMDVLRYAMETYVTGGRNDKKPIVRKIGVVYENDTTSPIPISETPGIHLTSKTESTTMKVTESIVNLKQNNTEEPKPNKIPHVENSLPIKEEDRIAMKSRVVLPIVGIIVVVPLVAVLFIVFYKHGSEWWQHRHYRRMDFLIDGMYNN